MSGVGRTLSLYLFIYYAVKRFCVAENMSTGLRFINRQSAFFLTLPSFSLILHWIYCNLGSCNLNLSRCILSYFSRVRAGGSGCHSTRFYHIFLCTHTIQHTLKKVYSIKCRKKYKLNKIITLINTKYNIEYHEITSSQNLTKITLPPPHLFQYITDISDALNKH